MASRRLRTQIESMTDEQLSAWMGRLDAEARTLLASEPRSLDGTLGTHDPGELAERRREFSEWGRAWHKNRDEYRLGVEILDERRRTRQDTAALRVASSVAAHAIEREVAEILLEAVL